MLLVKCVKGVVSGHLAPVNILKSLKNYNPGLSSDFFMTLAKVELQNVRLSVSEILGVFVNTLSADVMYSLRNRKILPQFNWNYLRNQKKFSQFFAAYLKSTSNVKQFKKR